MNYGAFPIHWCICGDTVEEHGPCYFGCRHFPALCCPECPCESFEEAHPEGIPDWHGPPTTEEMGLLHDDEAKAWRKLIQEVSQND